VRSTLFLALFLVLAFAAAAFGGLFPPGSWYEALTKPAWTPPNWLFGPVWTVLYVLVAVSGWLLWKTGVAARGALRLWGVQLLLNALWSWIFFGLRAPGAALIEIGALLITIAATIALAYRPCRTAAFLLTPYLVWVAFASTLNAAIWRLN
jgi:tryptophan-rich sensory protein